MRSIGERLNESDETLRRLAEKISADTRVAIPGIVHSFNPETQTAEIQPAIKERIVVNGEVNLVSLPLLVDVPVQFPRAGGYALTMPVNPGDECLVVFADMCIDAWYSIGGVQPQIEKRRHDLSDGIAIMGIWSQPNKLENYNNGALEIKHVDSGVGIVIDSIDVNVSAQNLLLNGIPFTGGEPGPQGPQGIQGPQGPIGLMGPQGIQGVPGPQGDIGPQGPQGSIGFQGVEGPQGDIGPQGPIGLTGPQGEQGPQGIVGPQGIKGDTGNTGIAGETGAQGIQGPIGLTGPQGPQGDIGPQGIPGESGDILDRIVILSAGDTTWQGKNDNILYLVQV
jgi:hypothetical protein